MTYKEKLREEYEKQSEKIKKANFLILHGNSIISCILKVAIRELGFHCICKVFDKGSFLDGELDIGESDNIVVILCSAREATRSSMEEDDRQYFPNAFVCDFYAIYYMWITQIIKRECDYDLLAMTIWLCKREQAIPNIDSINTLFCNLNCKECSNGIQYRTEKRKISIVSQIKYLDKITDKMPIMQCNFQGGEVFTDVGFSEFVEQHAHNARIAFFTIATNGTILPSDHVLETIKKTGCMVRISDYGELSKKKEELIRKCGEFKIPCFIYPMAEYWRKFGTFEKRGRTEQDLKKICAQCCFGTHDLMFIEDKIFCCLRTLFANAIQQCDDSAIRLNTFELNRDFSTNELEAFVRGDELWRMCDYCDFPMEIIKPAEQISQNK